MVVDVPQVGLEPSVDVAVMVRVDAVNTTETLAEVAES
jgi:hypothetical protein